MTRDPAAKEGHTPELDAARAQALADRAFQSENARLRERVKELECALKGVLADVTQPSEYWVDGSSVSIARTLLSK